MEYLFEEAFCNHFGMAREDVGSVSYLGFVDNVLGSGCPFPRSVGHFNELLPSLELILPGLLCDFELQLLAQPSGAPLIGRCHILAVTAAQGQGLSARLLPYLVMLTILSQILLARRFTQN